MKTTEKDGKVTGKIIFQASVFNRSNLLVGSGNDEVLDFELIREDDQVFIPASGFVGMLRKHFNKWVDVSKDNKLKKNARYFWGIERGEEEDLTQSHLILDDLIWITNKPTTVVRDGVGINPKDGRAKRHGKYDYELIEPDAEFTLNAEITIREENGFDKDVFLQLVNFMVTEGKARKYRQGAFTSHGFGELEWKYVKVYRFDFPTDADAWFDYCESMGVKAKSQ
jgi:CRISPR/Cas system CSM-associated protein Csm3 (group 7 of RAMP superfamily)